MIKSPSLLTIVTILLFFAGSGAATGKDVSSSKGIKTSIKRYTVFNYEDGEVICEPYVVKKDDWLYKIFRKKGEISESDFPHFLEIFKQLNENISNIDTIRPGQNIMIPLKMVNKAQFSQTRPGILDIPVIEYATMPDTMDIEPFVDKYQVKEGDTVSELIDRQFLDEAGIITPEGIEAFKLANPEIKNINLIYTGSYIHLPDPAIASQPWFRALFDTSPPDSSAETEGSNEADIKDDGEKERTVSSPRITTIDSQKLVQLNRYASLIGGTLKHTGKMYFPRQDQSTQVLDLEAFPLIETKDGKKMVLVSEGKIEDELLKSMKSYWNNLKVVRTSELIKETQLILSQQDDDQVTVTGLVKNAHFDNAFVVKQLLSYSRYEYIPNAEIPFKLNDIKLTATFGRIVRSPARPDLLINFGDVYGFALEEVRKKEFEILSITPAEAIYDVAQKIFSRLGYSIWENPSFKSDDGEVYTIEGLYFFKAREKLFLSMEQPDRAALDNLYKENVKLMKIGY